MIAVDAQDEACYALTADGQVWSWGKGDNAALGNANGNTTENAAVMVQVDKDGDETADGPIDNAVVITGGDTQGMCLDEVGFLWSVGGDWGTGQRGNPIGGYNNKDFATKVLAGEAVDSAVDAAGEAVDNVKEKAGEAADAVKKEADKLKAEH